MILIIIYDKQSVKIILLSKLSHFLRYGYTVNYYDKQIIYYLVHVANIVIHYYCIEIKVPNRTWAHVFIDLHTKLKK